VSACDIVRAQLKLFEYIFCDSYTK
jgi:hypothetical protein